MRILNRCHVVKLLNTVVGEEDPLESRAVIKSLNGLNEVPPEVDLGEGDEAVEPFDVGDQVVGQVQDAQLAKMADVLNLRDLVRMQVQYIQLRQVLKVPYALNIVLAEHEDAQGRHRVQVRDFFDAIIVQVQEDKRGQTDQVLDLRDVVMLQVQESEPLLAFKQGHVRQLTLVKIQPIWIGIPFGWFAVNDEHARDLWELRKNDLVFVFDSADYSVLEEVAITLILFVRRQL